MPAGCIQSKKMQEKGHGLAHTVYIHICRDDQVLSIRWYVYPVYSASVYHPVGCSAAIQEGGTDVCHFLLAHEQNGCSENALSDFGAHTSVISGYSFFMKNLTHSVLDACVLDISILLACRHHPSLDSEHWIGQDSCACFCECTHQKYL